MGSLFGRCRALLLRLPECEAAADDRSHPFHHWTLRSILISLALATFASMLLGTGAARANQFIRLDFNIEDPTRNRGTVFIELFDDRPLTRDNFLQYVDGGHYDGVLMHRLARNFVLQGGGFYPEFQPEPPPLDTSLDPTARVDLDGNPATPNPTVNNEFNNLPFRSNLKGTLAMAKLPPPEQNGPPNGGPDSATSEFFFNLGNNAGTFPEGLDFQNGGFTVFAQVVGDGMNLLDAYNGTSTQSGLPTLNLNPDVNDDGQRDGQTFNTVPVLSSGSSFIPLVLGNARRIDYFGAGITTNVPSGGFHLTRDAFVDTGAAFTGGTGPLIVDPGRTVGIREQIPLGRGLINNGRLEPGLQLGSITVDTYRNGSGGTLAVDLGGTTPDTGHDRLVVAGNAILAGRLDVGLLGGFVPRVGNTFTVLVAGSFTGDFSTFELPMLTPGMVWDINKTATTYSLSVVAADFNRNGVVDAADYVIWRRNRGTTVASSYAAGDATGDRMVTDADLAVWRANFGNIRGNTSGAGSGALASSPVPEPATLWLVILSSAALAADRRRSARYRRRTAVSRGTP